MIITLYQEIGGIIQTKNKKEIHVETLPQTLTKSSLISLINTQNPGSLDKDQTISYLNPTRKSYITLTQNSVFSPPNPLTLLARCSILSLNELRPLIHELETRLSALSRKLEHSSSKQIQKFVPKTFEENIEIDIALLGACPLVDKTDPIEENPLDFELERRRLKEKLSSENVGANIRLETATLDNLAGILESKPKIIYISCQARYKETPEPGFYLAFEQGSKEGIGCLAEVGWKDIKEILDNAPKFEGLVIVKGTYSQEMAKVLQAGGFPCVISVHQLPEHPMIAEDQSVHKFISELCLHLLTGKSVKDSFDIAYEDNNRNKEACCCAHGHKASCEWVRKLDLSHIYDNHKFHKLTCSCGKGQVHNMECQSATRFLLFNNIDLKDSDKIVICCCCSNMVNEGLEHWGFNYAIHCVDENFLDNVLFEAKKNILNIVSELPVSWKPPYHASITDGRRKEIYELINLIMKNRSVNLYGKKGLGKTITLKRTAFYIYERRMFSDGVVYFDFTKKDIVFLYRMISRTLNLPIFDHYNELFSALKDKDVLLILDNIDELISEENKTYFYQFYENFIKGTTKPKFLIGSIEMLKSASLCYYQLLDLTSQQIERFIYRRIVVSQLKKYLNGAPSSPSELLWFIEDKKNPDNRGATLVPTEMKIFNSYKVKVLGSTYVFYILKNLQFGIYRFSLEEIWPTIQATYNLNISLSQVLEQLFKQEELDRLLIRKSEDMFFKLNPVFLSVFLAHQQVQNQKLLFFKMSIKSLAQTTRSILQAALKDQFRIGFEYRSSLNFFNAGLENGIWARFKCSDSLADKISDPVSVFENIEYNCWQCLKVADIRKVYPGSLDEEIKGYLAEVIICCSSIFTLFGYKDALEFIERSKVFCRLFSLDNILGVITLIQASVLSNEGKIMEALDEVETAESFFNLMSDSEGTAECKLFKGLVTHNEALFIEARDMFMKISSEVGVGRSILAFVQFNEGRSEGTLEFCEEAVAIFNKLGLKLWKTRANLYMASYYFTKEKINIAREVLESTLASVKEYKDSKTEREIIKKLQEINEYIIKNNKNSICLLKSFPLIEHSSKESVSKAGTIWRYMASFRPDLYKELTAVNKKIYIRMDIASREKLSLALQEKPAVLHLASDMYEIDYLFLEKSNGEAEKIDFEDFKQIITDSPSRDSIKVITFAMPFSLNFAQRVHRELGIKHVVCFNFPDYPKDYNQILLNLIFEKAIHTFCIRFYASLVSGMSVFPAFSEAKEKMKSLMEADFYNYPYLDLKGLNVLEWWQSYMNADPVLIDSSNLCQNCSVFEYGPESSGGVVEISSIRAPCNVKCVGLPMNAYIGRQSEMHDLMALLAETRCINIFGCEGLGKTEFVKQVAYYLNVRNKYPDGIFLIQLREQSSLEDVYRVFKNEGINGLSIDIDPKAVLLDKKILFILENCESILQKAPHTLNTLLQKFVNECNISIIITSNNYLQKLEVETMKRFALRNLTRIEIYAILCTNYPNFVSMQLNTCEDNEMYTEIADRLLKDIRGVPGNVLKYRNLLNTNNLKVIREVLKQRDDLGDMGILPGLELKRSSSAMLKENSRMSIQNMPRLTQGKSVYEYLYKMNTSDN